MSGFQVWNEAGALTIDSDYRHTVFTRQWAPGIGPTGDYNIATPFGNTSELGFLNTDEWVKPDLLYWVRLNTNAWCFPGAWMFKPGTVQFLTTSRVQALQSGIMDVYNPSGGLIWSAASAGNMPRVRTLVSVPAAVDTAVQAVTPGFSPWFLLGACPGNLSDDGVVIGYAGLVVQWNGTQFRYQWIRQNQKTFAQTFSGRGGLKIPLAQFVGR